jgi:hypothetical protein
MIEGGVCVDNCSYLLSRWECDKWDHCTWIFDGGTGNGGSCVWKQVSEYLCWNIKRWGQCASGADIMLLSGKCGYYEDSCQFICPHYADKTSCLNSPSQMCFWLEKNGSLPNVQCVMKVFSHLIFIYFMM